MMIYWKEVARALRARATSNKKLAFRYQELLVAAQAEVERLKEEIASLTADRDERAKQKSEFFTEIERLKEDANRYYKIMGCVVRNCQNIDDTRRRTEPGPLCGPAWAKVSYLCGLGSHSAVALCKQFETDPWHDCRKGGE